MKRFLFIAIVMMFSVSSFNYTSANTPCCNSKMNHCSKCAKGCGPNCMDYCSKTCKASGGCQSTCK
jgi:hypothetical protein